MHGRTPIAAIVRGGIDYDGEPASLQIINLVPYTNVYVTLLDR